MCIVVLCFENVWKLFQSFLVDTGGAGIVVAVFFCCAKCKVLLIQFNVGYKLGKLYKMDNFF